MDREQGDRRRNNREVFYWNYHILPATIVRTQWQVQADFSRHEKKYFLNLRRADRQRFELVPAHFTFITAIYFVLYGFALFSGPLVLQAGQ